MNDFNNLMKQKTFIDWLLADKHVDFQLIGGVGYGRRKRMRSQCPRPKIFYTQLLHDKTDDQCERLALSIALAVLRTPQLTALPTGARQAPFTLSHLHQEAQRKFNALASTAHQIADMSRFRRVKIPALVSDLTRQISELQKLYGLVE